MVGLRQFLQGPSLVGTCASFILFTSYLDGLGTGGSSRPLYILRRVICETLCLYVDVAVFITSSVVKFGLGLVLYI